MGTVVGAIAAGNVPAGGNGDAFSHWLAPLPLLTGALFVPAAPTWRRSSSSPTRTGPAKRDGGLLRRRALAAGLLAGAVALFGLIALHGEARYVYDRLTVEGLPLVIFSMLCGLARARPAAAAAAGAACARSPAARSSP